MPRKSTRKRLTPVRKKSKDCASTSRETIKGGAPSEHFPVNDPVVESEETTSNKTSKNDALAGPAQATGTESQLIEDVLVEHAYVARPISPTRESFNETPPAEISDTPETDITTMPADSRDLLREAAAKISGFLHETWLCQIGDGGIHVLLMSRKFEKAVQRRLFCASDGSIRLSVHCKEVPTDCCLEGVNSRVPLKPETVNSFVHRCVEIVNNVRKFEICSGYSDNEFKHSWSAIPDTKIDCNPYQEDRYSETLRSKMCPLLIPVRKWRCTHCDRLRQPLQRRSAAFEKEEPHFNTPNVALSDAQKLWKLEMQHKKLDACHKKISRLESKIQELIAVEGVNIDKGLSEDLMDVLRGHEVTETQAFFIQQQLKASEGSPSSVRWHPTMIRFALALYMASPACYQIARDSGMIKLPSQRTLFDYTHCNEAKEGVNDAVLENLSKRLEKMKHPYQRYHALLCDEMHICQNLVYKKSTGEMIGYEKLNEVNTDIAALENFLSSGDARVQPQLATKMLSFMVKGIANDVKEVVASYSVNRLTSEFLYTSTWEVITRCERVGCAVVVFVSDGYSVNRTFMRKHKPARTTKSGIIYATVNKADPERLLFFMSDVAHLLKTIRNCLHNSCVGKKGKRCLTKGGEKMLWKTIVDLFNAKSSGNLRKSYKLTSQNVLIDSFSAMKVKFAAEVLSRTVAQDLEDMKWPNTVELIKFIRLVNDWFDCLNGAFSTQGQKKLNPNLNPYISVDDDRFTFLVEFLDYLTEWKEEVFSVEAFINDEENPNDLENESFDLIEDQSVSADFTVHESEVPASKKILSSQTLMGIEFTTIAFVDLCKFLLGEGMKFVNPRSVSQDHLEQYFSKQRFRSGGSSNPNYGRYLQNANNIHIQGQLGVKVKRGNTENVSGGLRISDEPLLKRRRSK